MRESGGDFGESGLLDGSRLKKNEPVFRALGDVDELSSSIGVIKAHLSIGRNAYGREIEVLEGIQKDLVRVGAQIATPETDKHYAKLEVITATDIGFLEEHEKSYGKNLEMPKVFVLTGATVIGAYIDVSRAVCRRAERQVVSCITERGMGWLSLCQRYLNRLSDLLFTLARWFEKSTE